MRVTSASMFAGMQQNLGDALTRVQGLQEQLSSGRRINRLSDAPADVVSVLRLQSAQSAQDGYNRAANDSLRWLDLADTQLQSASTTLRQISDLAVQSQSSALSPDARAAIAEQLTQLRDQLRDIANTQNLGRAIFGGFGTTAVTSTTDPTTGAQSWSYAGDGGEVRRQVSPSVTVAVNLDGRAIFGFDGAPGSDVFSSIDKLASDIRNGDTAAVSADQTTMRGFTSRVSTALTRVGALTNRVQTALDDGKAAIDDAKSAQSNLEDADMASTVLQLNEANLGYQAALAAAGKAGSLPSLASFLS